MRSFRGLVRSIFALNTIRRRSSAKGRIVTAEILEGRALLAFTAGNIAVYRVGTGASALTNAATATFIDEYSPTGTLISSTPMPTAVSGFNRRLTNSGTATSEGALSLSADGRYLTVAGYDAATGTASVAGTSTTGGTPVERVVAAVDVDQVINTKTRTTSFSANNIRGAVMSSSGGMWLTGANSGVIYLPLESNGTGTAVATTTTNLRVPGIFGGQLYVSSGASGLRIGSVGTGTPTGVGNTISTLPGFTTTSGSPYQFFLADLSATVAGPDTLYVADDAGTLQKYSLNSGSWAARGTVTVASCRGVTGVVSGGTVTLYATGTNLVKVTDTSGYDGTLTGTATTLASPGTNTAFRGVALVPTRLPAITSLTPADDATGVTPTADLQISFNKNIFAATGSILIKKLSDNSTASSLDVTGASVSISGSVVTLNPPADLESGTDYYVQIPSTALRDEYGNLFAGITDNTTWNFSTASAADTTPPTILTLSPADNSTSAAVNADLVITFSETIAKGTGNIVVRKSSDDSIVHTIDVTSALVTVAGSTATINPSSDLQNLTDYYVQVPATAFRDASSNFFAGIADKTTWNFTTVPDTAPPTIVSIDDGDADNSVVAGTLMTYTVTFSEDISESTVSAADFDNAGTSSITIGTITETAPGIFSVQVTPTTGGTLILRIPASATISDVAGNSLVGPVSDNDTVTVSADNTPPTLLSFVDDRSGAAINANLPVVYTVTFDEDIDAASVTAADFSNAGTATIQVGTISEPSPGIFTVTITPRSSGTLRLQIPAGAIITDLAGNQFVPPGLDDTTITVNSVTTLTAGDIAFTGIQTDDPDTFSFVLLKDVVNGTQIVFTDNLWNGTALATNENTLTLTLNSSGSGFSAGTHFVNTNGGTAPAFRIIGTSTSAGLVTGAMSGLSTSGDSILAYQGSAPSSGASSAWIAGINTKKWYDAATPDPTGTNESRLPAALTLGTHAIQLSSTATEFDNGALNLTSFTGTARVARIRVNSLSNWTTSDTVGPLSTTSFTIQANQAPTDLSLSGTSVAENQPVGTTLGTLSATDPNSDESFTFSLNSALVDNALFSISGTSLLTAAGFDFETRSSYQVTVRVTDVEGLTFDKTFTITVTDVNEAPSITSSATWSTAEANTIGIQGSQSSASPYLTSRNTDVQFTSLFTVGDSVGGYKMAGIPDGMGAWDNGDGTFTLLVNHEIGNTLGIARAHGQKGAFVSRWVISKSTLQVTSIQDFLPNSTSVYLSNNDQNSGTVHSAWLPASTSIFSRFCSADLAAPTAWRWTDPATSITYGTDARIFQTGEESGGSVTGVGPETTTLFGRQFAFVATDDSSTPLNETGTAWELPHGGLFSWENNLANPTPQRKTIVIGLDDSSPGGQLYVWVGDKQTTGNVVERAGLTRVSASDSLYVVKVNGLAADATGATPELASASLNGTFSLVDEGDVSGLTVTGHDNRSNSLGGTKFLRPEDGSWDPQNPADFYFVTTNQLDQVQDGIGSQIGRSRLYRLRFTDISNPVAGGSITCLLDGTEGANMLDNITVSGGKVILQEDVGNAAHLGKVWSYDIASDALTELAQHDRTRFGDIGVAAASPFNVDEESSGVIDVSSILGSGTFLLNVQAHYTTTTELVEGGQLLLMKTNVASGQSLVGTQTATDPDAGTVFTWSITGGADQAKFVIDAATGKLSFAVAPSFETPADANTDNVYLVTIRVSDGTNTATQNLQVTVTPVNESPVNTTPATANVLENTTAVTTATGIDPEGTALTWAISGGADAAKFAINSTTGALTFITAPDFEAPTDNGANNTYFVTVTCSDGVNPPVNKTVVVTVTNLNTESTGIDVQLGQTQRSYVRYLDLLFSTSSELAALISGNRFQLTKNDLNGVNPVSVPLTAGMFSTIGARARLDFGLNGLGGNRNTSDGDGYYEIAMDLDSNGTFETKKYFYRLLGDVNGDRKVDSADATLIGAALGTANPERDVNGDGVVNANDRTLALRANLRKLKDGLLTDD